MMRVLLAVSLCLSRASAGLVRPGPGPLSLSMRRPALASAIPEQTMSSDEFADFALDNVALALKFDTYVLDASIFIPIIPGVRNVQVLQPIILTVYALSNPYFHAFRSALPFQFGRMDLSYIPAFYALSFARREIAKRQMQRMIARRQADIRSFEHLYS